VSPYRSVKPIAALKEIVVYPDLLPTLRVDFGFQSIYKILHEGDEDILLSMRVAYEAAVFECHSNSQIQALVEPWRELEMLLGAMMNVILAPDRENTATIERKQLFGAVLIDLFLNRHRNPI
jgi:hypothetical protein